MPSTYVLIFALVYPRQCIHVSELFFVLGIQWE